jgi:hypothetical protein
MALFLVLLTLAALLGTGAFVLSLIVRVALLAGAAALCCIGIAAAAVLCSVAIAALAAGAMVFFGVLQLLGNHYQPLALMLATAGSLISAVGMLKSIGNKVIQWIKFSSAYRLTLGAKIN